MSKIVYNKAKSGRLMGGGGPRDRQVALQLKQQRELLSGLRPAMTAEVSKLKTVTEPQQTQQAVDLSQYLPLKEVRKKIEEAVVFTRNKEQQRFESGLKNINDQLKAERKKTEKSDVVPIEFEKRLIEKSAEISKLNLRLIAVDELYEKSKEEIIVLQNQIDSVIRSDNNIVELQKKMDKLYDKIADGYIQSLVGSEMDRPALEDKIFIDPLEKDKEPDLDAHIDITEEDPTKGVDSDMMTDLSKLKGLLNLD